jgi:predicted NBD/HSP70 family sugar kinase
VGRATADEEEPIGVVEVVVHSVGVAVCGLLSAQSGAVELCEIEGLVGWNVRACFADSLQLTVASVAVVNDAKAALQAVLADPRFPAHDLPSPQCGDSQYELSPYGDASQFGTPPQPQTQMQSHMRGGTPQALDEEQERMQPQPQPQGPHPHTQDQAQDSHPHPHLHEAHAQPMLCPPHKGEVSVLVLGTGLGLASAVRGRPVEGTSGWSGNLEHVFAYMDQHTGEPVDYREACGGRFLLQRVHPLTAVDLLSLSAEFVLSPLSSSSTSAAAVAAVASSLSSSSSSSSSSPPPLPCTCAMGSSSSAAAPSSSLSSSQLSPSYSHASTHPSCTGAAAGITTAQRAQARAELRRCAVWLGRAIATTIAILNPGLVVLGGGVLRFPGVLQLALAEARRLSYPQMWTACTVLRSDVSDQLVACGALVAGFRLL